RDHDPVARCAAREDRGRDRRRARGPPRAAGKPACGRSRVMTAPLRSPDAIVVDVALGARSYDIIIGRAALGLLGQRMAALRPGAKAAIVTDETVAKYHLAAARSALDACG